MSTYCPTSEVEDLLPPNSVGTGDDQITAALLAEYVTAGSDGVNDWLAHLYWPFTNYSASPPASPPRDIRVASAHLAASLAYAKLRSLNANVDDSEEAKHRASAIAIISPYADRKQQIAPISTSQLLHSASWGDGDPLTTNQAYLTVTEAEIIIDSATIANYIYGDDFIVYYLTNHRRWVVERYDSAIGSATSPSGDTITFEYSLLKKRESVTPGIRSIDLLRG
jgi:hypothetical protein